MPHPRTPVDCDDSRPDHRNPPSGEWEPEPLHLPIEAPRHRPRSIDPSSPDESEPEPRVIVIDLA